ncbi:MAG: hypothetical protein R3E76_01235 [Planctomycetota bacterium]
MKLPAALSAAVLLLAGCVSGPPPRDDAYWANFVNEERPVSADDGSFLASGEAERSVALAEDSAFRFKFIETINRAPIWVINIENERSGYFIFTESWIDGAIPRNRQRKLQFTLSESEYASARQVLIDSGLTSVRPHFASSGRTDWSIGLGAGGDTMVVTCEGAYPNEARRAVEGAYDVVVRPRAKGMKDAPVFDPEDWQHAPEYQPLR